MRGQLFCGAIGVVSSLALMGCQPYNYGQGYYGYGPYGSTAYGYGPYGSTPYGYDPYGSPPYGYGPYSAYPPAAPYAMPQSLSQTSSNFVINVALGESYQIQAGTMARQRATSQQIRRFADQVVQGNTLLTQRLATVLQNNGTPVMIPAAQDPQHQAMINDLTVAQGPDFDRRYAIQQVVAHQDALAMLQNYAQSGDNPALRQFAQQVLPSVQQGLRLAQTLPGAAGTVPAQYSGLAAINSATCRKGLLWPFVREPGDCPTDAERFSSYSPYP